MHSLEQDLQKLLSITREVSGMVEQGDLDAIMNRLKERQKLISRIQVEMDDSENLLEQKSVIQIIADLDQRNMDVLQARLKDIYQDLLMGEADRGQSNRVR